MSTETAKGYMLLFIDFVQIFFIFNLFQRNFRGSFCFKTIPSLKKSQVDFKGGRGSSHYGRRVSDPLWTQSNVSPLFSLESFP